MSGELNPLPDDLPKTTTDLAQVLRTLFAGLDVSLTRYAARVHRDKGTVSRYFSGDRIPPWDFVNDLLIECTLHNDGSPPTAPVVAHLRRLHRAALEASDAPAHQIQLLQDKLAQADREATRAAAREHELETTLQEARRRIAELQMRERELEALRDEERDAYSADLTAYQHDLGSEHRSAHALLLEEIERLQKELETAHHRRIAAEARCEELERQLDITTTAHADTAALPDRPDRDQTFRALEEIAERIRADVDRRFAQLTNVPEAFGLQPLDSTRAAELVKVVQNAYAFEHRSSPLANAFIQAEAQRFNLLLHQLRAGEGTCDGEDRDWLLTLTRTCTRTLDATSLTTTDAGGQLRFSGGFWESDLGLHYLELQAEAVRRGVTIRRVFILEHAKVTEDLTYQAMCERQRRLGFEIRYLVPDMVSVGLHNKLDDFILFDNEISYEVVASLTPGDARPVISSTHLALNRMLVAKRVRQFAEIWDAALPL